VNVETRQVGEQHQSDHQDDHDNNGENGQKADPFLMIGWGATRHLIGFAEHGFKLLQSNYIGKPDFLSGTAR